MMEHKHRFFTTIEETVECFDTKCDFKITKDRLWELLELGLNSAQHSIHLTALQRGLNLSLALNVILFILLLLALNGGR